MGRFLEPYRIKERGGRWYYKLRNETAFHSTGIAVNNPKSTRRKAEKYCENLLAISSTSRGFKSFGAFAAVYFKDDNCPWWTRRTGSGKIINIDTRDQHRARLDNHILPQFEKHLFSELSPIAIERWIFSLNYSSQWKKHIYNTLKIIIDDLRREQLINFSSADITPPVVRNSEKAILSDIDALKLFPVNQEEFRAVWGKAFQTGVFMALLYSAGLRTSEARAAVWASINWEYSGIKIIQTINKDGKAWVPKGKAIRVVPLPGRTLDLLKLLPEYIKAQKDGRQPSGFIFPGKRPGEIIDISSPAQNLKRTRLKEAINIKYNITPHGLRHTYNTRMRAILAAAGVDEFFSDASGFLSATAASDSILRAFTGHKSPNMTELYDHPELDKKLIFIDKNFRDQVELIWNLKSDSTT